MAHKLKYLLAVILACAPAFAGTPGAIAGYVKSTSGIAQAGAAVEVFTSSASLGRVVFADAQGHYTAENLSPGVYFVKVSAAAFLPALRENVNVRAGTRVLVNMTLSTFTEALKLLPQKNTRRADDDDWHWTLRSGANRPILRVMDGAPLVVSTAEDREDHPMKAQVAFIAGSEADGFGSSSDMTTAFALEKSLFSSSTVSFNGNIGSSSSGDPAGVLRISYTHDFGDISRPKIAVTYRHFTAPGVAIRDGAYSAVEMAASDSMEVAGVLDLNYGANLQGVEFARRVTAFRPFGSADLHVAPNMVVEYRYATSVADNRAEKGFDTAPADLSESGPRMTLGGGIPEIEKAQHHEVSVSRRFGKNNIQVAYFVDRIHNLVLTGVGDPSGYSDNVLPDVYSGTFSYGGGTLSTTGARVVVQRKFSEDLTATVDYSTGGAVEMNNPANAWQNVSSSLAAERHHTLGAKFSGYIPISGTRWVTSYRWTSGNTLSPVDEFNSSPGQMDPYFSVFVRQPIPGTSFVPGKLEALVDVRNLLSQGYTPVMGQDGRFIYLTQSCKAVRGGLAFVF
ncbi:MAG TPA: carboxypeptidase-like regulatory domain-containing protein [Candidatus Angelobacter sp.]|nr:carboxypeptidase-like regulatory domain-containing protein [Candidatus Angelobacter sp.]